VTLCVFHVTSRDVVATSAGCQHQPKHGRATPPTCVLQVMREAGVQPYP
jgi:hypothetical protein